MATKPRSRSAPASPPDAKTRSSGQAVKKNGAQVLHEALIEQGVEVVPVAGTLQKVAVLVPLRRDVVVESSPPGGQVWIDGVLHGALPRRLEELAYGRTVSLRVTWPRGPTVERELRVGEDTPERLVVQAP